MSRAHADRLAALCHAVGALIEQHRDILPADAHVTTGSDGDHMTLIISNRGNAHLLGVLNHIAGTHGGTVRHFASAMEYEVHRAQIHFASVPLNVDVDVPAWRDAHKRLVAIDAHGIWRPYTDDTTRMPCDWHWATQIERDAELAGTVSS